MRYIDERNDLAGKMVLVRTGLNVPMRDGAVVNDFRIRKALPTLQFLKEQGAKIIVISHIGRDVNNSLREVAKVLNEHIPTTCVPYGELDAARLKEGEIVLLENLRQDPREVANDNSFAQELAAHADLFVQDAFSVCHREHASIVGIPKYIESYGGLLLQAEVSVLQRALEPEHPALFVIGGSKFATKEPLIAKFLDLYDSVFVGGALQNEILAAHGLAVGASVIEDGHVPAEILNHVKLRTVTDVVVEHADGARVTVSADAVNDNDTIVDIGEETIAALTAELSQYKTVVWNGPLGWYEKGYTDATLTLARALADCGAYSIIGGGDTVAAVQEAGVTDTCNFISTGGGAMLQFLQDGTLPGLEALK